MYYVSTCVGQRTTCRSYFFFPILWVLGTGLGSSGGDKYLYQLIYFINPPQLSPGSPGVPSCPSALWVSTGSTRCSRMSLSPRILGSCWAAVQHSQAFYREQSHMGVLVIPCFSFTWNVPVFTLTGVLYVSSAIPSVCYFCF